MRWMKTSGTSGLKGLNRMDVPCLKMKNKIWQ